MFQRILVPIDLGQSDQSRGSLAQAAALAKAGDAKLDLVTVLPEVPGIVAVHLPADYPNTSRQTATEDLTSLATANGLAADAGSIIVRHGPIYQEILKTAEELGSDLIVIASHKPEAADYLLGSVAAKVVRHAGCSVMVLRG